MTILKFGSLPFPIQEVSAQQISATLGEQFLAQSLIAGAIGILLVITFMVAYYRLPGLVASFALVYYTIVVYAIFRTHPGDADPGRHRRLRPVDRHGGGREHPHLRADEGGAATRQVPAGGRRGRVQPRVEFDPRLERLVPHHGDDPVLVRVVHDPRLRARPDHRRPRLDVQRDRRDPHDHALDGPPRLGPQALDVRHARRRVPGAGTRRARRAAEGP